MGLFYPYRGKRNNGSVESDPTRQNATFRAPPPLHQNDNDVLMGFADAGYLSDPHKGRSQTGYVFTMGSTAISWRSTKQTLVATSSNHAEIIALHEAVRECVWLRSVIRHIQGSCGLKSWIIV